MNFKEILRQIAHIAVGGAVTGGCAATQTNSFKAIGISAAAGAATSLASAIYERFVSSGPSGTTPPPTAPSATP